MKRKTSKLVAGAALTLAFVGGSAAGVWASVAPTLLAPHGVSTTSQSEPMPQPTWGTNAQGLTYGSLLDSNSPENEPDLIQAVATNGREGYILKSDLDRANGTDAAENFKSPEEALKWQATSGQADQTIPVYALDGKSVIGNFVIAGAVTQAKLAPGEE